MSGCLWQKGEKKNRIFVWDILRRLTRQVKSKRGSKMQKVEVATQTGQVKIQQAQNWAEKIWHERKARHLQASNNNSFDTPGTSYMRRRDCKYRLYAALNFRALNSLHKQKLEIKYVCFCLPAHIFIHVHGGYTRVWKDSILSDIYDEFQIFCKRVKGNNHSTIHMKVLLK